MSREIEGVECSIEWCQKTSCYRRPKGYQSEFPVCQTHYWQWREWGEFRKPKWGYSNTDGGCSVEGCDRAHKAKGLCETHWSHQKAGKPLAPLGPKKSELPVAKEKDCIFPDCGRPQFSLSLCATHWGQQNSGKELTKIRIGRKAGDRCLIANCDKVYGEGGDALHGGFCRAHGRLKNVWGLSVGQIERISVVTECPICGRSGEKMHIDHDHACCPGGKSCGKCVRGYVCSGCNTGLGYFRDDINALRRAIDYLGGDGWIGD